MQITLRFLINLRIRTQNSVLIIGATKIQRFHGDSVFPGPILLQWLRRQRSKNIPGPIQQQPSFPPSASYQHRARSSPADLVARVRRRPGTTGSLQPLRLSSLFTHRCPDGFCLPGPPPQDPGPEGMSRFGCSDSFGLDAFIGR